MLKNVINICLAYYKDNWCPWLKTNHRFKLTRLFLSSFHNVRSLAVNFSEGMGDSCAVSGGEGGIKLTLGGIEDCSWRE